MDNTKSIQHLYWRAGFGINYPELGEISAMKTEKAVERILKDSSGFTPIEVVPDYFPKGKNLNQLTPDENVQLENTSRDYQRVLTTAWYKKMAEDPGQLREKMTYFWHCHFAANSHSYWLQKLNNIMREHALGKFRTLLLNVSQSQVMLLFLNNQQNVKTHPNENFARELMELYTIGRGNYTERDIKEAARAFTGWSFDFATAGEYKFKPQLHDEGIKTFMGHSGNWNGEDIIDMLLQKKETAMFLCRKIYRYFVNDTPNEGHVKEMAEHYYKSDYDTGSLMQMVFTSPWFYAPENIGGRIKSPVELIAGMLRTFRVKINDPKVIYSSQYMLGQNLFYPPNVAGWPGGRNWIDSTSMAYRMKLPSVLLNSGEMTIPQDANNMQLDFVANMAVEKKASTKEKAMAAADWQAFASSLPSGMDREKLADYLLQAQLPAALKPLITDSKLDIKEAALRIVSLPQYQVC